jgi:hypothetical protein
VDRSSHHRQEGFKLRLGLLLDERQVPSSP